MEELKAQANQLVEQMERRITERKAQRIQNHRILSDFLLELLANAEATAKNLEEEDEQMLEKAKVDLEAIGQCLDVVAKLHIESSTAKRA